MDKKEEKRIEKAAVGKAEVRLAAILLLVFAIISIVFDLILTKGYRDSNKELSANAEFLVLIMAYVLSFLALIASFVGLHGKKPKAIVFFGTIMAIVGLASAISKHLLAGKLDYLPIILGVLGLIYIFGGMKMLKTYKE